MAQILSGSTAQVNNISPTVQASSPKEALRMLAEQAQASERDERHIASYYSDQLAVLTSELEFSDKSTRLLLALLGLSEGRESFDCSYEAIYLRLRKFGPDLRDESGQLKSSASQTVRRYIKALRRDEEKAGVSLASIKEGDKIDGKLIPTRVTLPLLDYLDEINTRTKLSSSYTRASKSIRMKETRKLAAELRLTGGYSPKEKPVVNPMKKIRQLVRQTAGMIDSTINTMEAQNYTDEAIQNWLLQELSPKAKSILLGKRIAHPGDPERSLGEHGRGDSSESNLTPMLKNKKGVKTDTLPKLHVADSQEFAETRNVENLHFAYLKHDEGAAQIGGELETADPEQTIEAFETVEAFESVGAALFDTTLTDKKGQKVDYDGGQSAEYLKGLIPSLIETCERDRLNLITRPRLIGEGRQLIQLDDCDSTALLKLKDFAFLMLETSPNNYQAWVCATGENDLARRLKLGVGADVSASGATRIGGSTNFKEKYAPNYPRVRIKAIASNRVVDQSELDRAGLLAAKAVELAPRLAPIGAKKPTRFPDYGRCLNDVPGNRDGSGPDRSRADWNFAVLSYEWGWSVEDIAQQLMMVSEKARAEGYSYALFTSERAARFIQTGSYS